MKKFAILVVLLSLLFIQPAGATLTSSTTKLVYNGSGSTGPFAYTFYVYSTSDLLVTKYDSVGTPTTLVLNTGYTATKTPATGKGTGTITLTTALATGETLVIMRNMSYLQSQNWTNNASLTATSLNDMADKLDMQIQQLKEASDRSFQLPLSNTTGPLRLDPVASELIGWCSDGINLCNYSTNPTAVSVPTIDYIGNYGGSLATALASIGSNNQILQINSAITVSADTTVPANVQLWVPKGGSIAVTAGKTLAINGPFTAGLYPIFSGTGTITWGTGVTKEVYPQWWGALGNGLYHTNWDGTTDDTTGIQAAFNSGLPVYFPPGRYYFTALIIPNTYNLDIGGAGPSSILTQTGTGITWTYKATLVQTCDQSIHDLAFDGTNGTGHTISTQYVSQMRFSNLWFFNVPTGYASMFLNGNPVDGTYAHDVTLHNIKIYHQNSGNGSAGIYLGAKHSDCLIDSLIFKGNSTTDYGILADTGAETTRVTNAHIYGAKINNVKLSGSNSYFIWNAVTFDDSLQDLVYLTGTSKNTFTGCFFENIRNSYSGIVYDNSYYNVINNGVFKAYSTTPLHAVSQVNISGTGANLVTGGSVDTVIAGIATPFVASTGSTFRDIAGFRTENGGTATGLSSGSTVAHGLSVTPNWVVLTSAQTGNSNIYVTSIGATTFTVNFTTGTNQTFYWRAGL